jgi:hypothetical protein
VPEFVHKPGFSHGSRSGHNHKKKSGHWNKNKNSNAAKRIHALILRLRNSV